jgi:multidrug efflux pump subunit AcrA (membrane-fusion protein)
MSENKKTEIEETENERIESDGEFTEAETEVKENNFAARNPRNWVIGGVVVLLILSLIALFVWRRSGSEVSVKTEEAEKNEAGRVKFLMEQQWLIRMKLAQAEEQSVSRQITSTGRVVPASNSQAVVSTPVAGILSDRQLPTIGQYVGAGQTIAFIRQTPTSTEQAQTRAAQTQIELAEAQLETQKRQMQMQNSQIEIENARLETEKRAASGDVETARVRLEQARREADRMQRLFDGKAASQKQLQAAQSEREAAQVAFDSAVRRRDALNKAAPVKPARVNTVSDFGNVTRVANGYTVSAPFGGYVTKVNKSIGEQVSPGDAIVEISRLDTVYVEAPIFERDLNALGASRTATFTVSAYPEQEFKGTVLDLGSTIDEQTRAANVIFTVENAGRALRLGMQANVRLDGEQTVTAMMIPKESVIEAEGKKLIYVLIDGEEFERREVTLGDEYGDKVAVLTGLNKGERVVTQGAYQIRLQELRPADTGVHSHET